jgi:hypothetical protein
VGFDRNTYQLPGNLDLKMFKRFKALEVFDLSQVDALMRSKALV